MIRVRGQERTRFRREWEGRRLSSFQGIDDALGRGTLAVWPGRGRALLRPPHLSLSPQRQGRTRTLVNLLEYFIYAFRRHAKCFDCECVACVCTE